MKQLIIGKHIDTSYFKNIKFKGQGSFGLVMICEFHLDGKLYNVALKMLMNFSDVKISSSEHRKKINEFNILPQIQQHPNIVCLIGSFQSDDMIDFVDESIRDLCFDHGLKKKCQFYILEKYAKTLESVIHDFSEEKIVKYSLQLSSALLFLFHHNIAHLDVKCDNLKQQFYYPIQMTLILIAFQISGGLSAGCLSNCLLM